MVQSQKNQTSAKDKSAVIDRQTDIVEVILEDHKPLKELIKVMKDSDSEIALRKAAFQEFAPLLIAHAKPEEETLYVYMKGNKELREEGFEGDVEHQLADQLLEECKRTTDDDLLGARIKVLAELVEHHIEEEEEELLPDFKKNSDEAERIQLGNRFFGLKASYLAAGDDNVITDPNADLTDRH